MNSAFSAVSEGLNVPSKAALIRFNIANPILKTFEPCVHSIKQSRKSPSSQVLIVKKTIANELPGFPFVVCNYSKVLSVLKDNVE